MGEVVLAVLMILAVIAAVGHGIWVLVAAALRLVFGGSQTSAPPRELKTRKQPPENAHDALFRVREQLLDFEQIGALDESVAVKLREAIDREAQALRTAEAASAPAPLGPVQAHPIPDAQPKAEVSVAPASQALAPAVPTTPVPRRPRSIADRVRAYASGRQSAAASPTPEAEPAPARPRREPLSNVLKSFMEEKNIRWGELVGGLLIVGSSIALVISFWAEIAARPLLKFVLFNGVTAALFCVGLYTDRKWKIHTTSDGILIIATLLVPLNFLAIAAFTQDSPPTDIVSLAGEALTTIVFTLLIYVAARIIAPDAPQIFTAGVILPSLAQLAVRRWAGPQLQQMGQLALAATPVAAYVVCATAAIRRYWRQATASSPLNEQSAQRVFTFIGVLSAAACLPLALLVLSFRR